ncbi:MAG: recombinase family protein [Butyrivibrio hungatei]|nr:recombinase family protein [Butyrivibrio hungatei]
MSKIVGYARVSTSEQNLDRQLQALSRYVEPDMIVTDKSSGRDLNRPGYQSLKVGIGKLVEGDTLYIKSLDRLSRNKEDLKKELQYFKDKGIKVKILDMPTTMTDFPMEQAWIGDMITNIMIEVLSSIAQNERETTRQRQLEGLAAMPTDSTGKKISRRTGNPIGRPPVTYPKKWDSVYKDWQDKKITARQAMRLLNLKPNSFYKLAKEYSEK